MMTSLKYYILRIKQGHGFDFKDFGFPVKLGNVQFWGCQGQKSRGGGNSLIKVGMDVRAKALGISGVNFCPGIRFWEVNFAWALGFGQFLTKNV